MNLLSNDQQHDDAGLSSSGSNDDDSGNLTSAGEDQLQGANHEAPTLAGSDTKRVNRSKRLVYLVLLLAAMAVGLGSYFFVHSGEKQNFHSKFDGYADALVKGSDQNAKDIFGQLLSLSNSLTSYSSSLADKSSSNSTSSSSLWPNTTVPNFDIRAKPAFDSTSSPELFLFAPIVSANAKKAWEEYAWENQGWIKEDQKQHASHDCALHHDIGTVPRRIHPFFPDEEYDLNEIETFVPIWQVGPLDRVSNASVLLLDLYSHPSFRRMIDDAMTTRHMLLSEVLDPGFLQQRHGSIEEYDKQEEHGEHDAHDGQVEHDEHDGQVEHDEQDEHDAYNDQDEHDAHGTVRKLNEEDVSLHSFGIQPVFETFEEDSPIVGFIFAVIPWDIYFSNVLQSDASGLLVEVTDTCGTAMTYAVDGLRATLLGPGLLHDTDYDNIHRTYEFADFARFDEQPMNAYAKHCAFTITIFPTVEFQNSYCTNQPAIIAATLVCVFLFTMLVFKIYDIMVQQRQNKVMATATRTTQLVSSLFPAAIHDRIMTAAAEQMREQEETAARQKTAWFGGGTKDKLKVFLDEGATAEGGAHNSGHTTSAIVHKGTPIADLFPSASVLFADLVGFTAWSSVREPAQVFQLLETLYSSFDELARRRRVYKVETIGDCWVGACGLPEVRTDHAVCIARFSRDMLQKMKVLVKQLERDLGPDTGELAIRIGIHSGPVTAGVLRGDRARFQLFGDTVNTAARMESNGQKNKIHISKETADLLRSAGKERWFTAREDKIIAKGKGEMETFWLRFESHGSSNESSRGSSDLSSTGGDDLISDVEDGLAPVQRQLSEKHQRLVAWNVEVLTRLLKEIQLKRQISGVVPDSETKLYAVEMSLDSNSLVFDELVDIIQLSDCRVSVKTKNVADIELSPRVTGQLSHFLSVLASYYRENAFHNFEHASHVTMSVVKLLSRIVRPDIVDTANEKTLHDHTYGLTSDPLLQFSVVFSALIHDAEHPGVPNATLLKENDALAVQYKGQSIAEQHSIDVAWDLLQKDEYIDLRRAIYSTEDELRRFRQLVVNTVMATDIADKELGAARKQRWNLAFAPDSTVDDDKNRDRNRKATIVIEHLIQASDIAHTMQHWHIYRKWNERFFTECYQAYKDGRTENDPSEYWYKGEIGFYDFYIIPLAKKLDDCKVFGVSSDEYLNYAISNRREWEHRGQEIVASMVEKATNNTTLAEK